MTADEDQAASDRDLALGLSRKTYESSRDARDQTAQVRQQPSRERHDTAATRDVTASRRDLVALERDRAAEVRDRGADERDAETAYLESDGSNSAKRGEQIILRAARDRQRAAVDRTGAAVHRAKAGNDREHAARDRGEAARDRQLAASERSHSAGELEAAALDALTGTWQRGPGLGELQREIDRARRGTGQLVAAYVDVDGLKAINDSEGHSAGDAVLKDTIGVVQAHLRSYEAIVRLGGDEFLCAVSDATIEDVRKRFDEINRALATEPQGGSITVGYAELSTDDAPMDLVDRADADLLAARRTRTETDTDGRD